MSKISLSFSPPLKTITVWAGLYGGHYDCIILFDQQPTPSKEEHNYIEGTWYDCSENSEKIIASMELGQFKRCFPGAAKALRPYLQDDLSEPGDGRPMEIEIPEIFQMELQVPLDKDGFMDRINFSLDW